MSARLNKIVERKREIDLRRRTEEQKQLDEKLRQKERREVAEQLWKEEQKVLEAAIVEVNTELEGSGLCLSYQHEDENCYPALCKDAIWLRIDGSFKRQKIVLNINAFGLVQAVFLLPHSGRGQKFELEDAAKEIWIELMADFLEQCLAHGQ